VNAGNLVLTHDLALGGSSVSGGLGSGNLVFDSSVSSHAFTFGALSGGGTVNLLDNASNAVALTIGNNGLSPAPHTGSVTGPGSLNKIGTGTITLADTLGYTGATTVSAGTLLLQTNLTASSSVSVTGGTLRLDVGGGNLRIVRTPSLSVTASGRLDIGDNKIITQTPVGSWNGSAYTDVTGLIAAGRNTNGAPLWDGAGIVTSQSDAAGGNFNSIGVARASDVRPNTISETATWAGQTITGTDTLVMYTYGGDATLDGKINVDDYIRIDSGIAAGLTGWSNGDFNYDGKINIDDYTTAIDANIGIQNGIFATSSALGGGTSGVSAVPEPASAIAMLGLASAGLFRRRRRCN
jgi:autotransporter-associated beta strand protein